jgi:dienelactone hydrolase
MGLQQQTVRTMSLRAMVLLAVVAAATALPAAAETVRFRTATTLPSPLQQRLAKERGEAVPVQATEQISGELYRPAGAGPFPAVVSLHGCGGRGQASDDALGARVTALGYVLLAVDSFGLRDIAHRCTAETAWPADRVMDAYGALHYLAGLPFVDADRVAVLGFSQGAMIALSAVQLGGIETLFDRHFSAAIAYYPYCGEQNFAVPTLILIGELDDWTPATACQAMMERRSSEGAAVRLVVYPGAWHAFNFPRPAPTTAFGHRLEYNEVAAHSAWEETVGALRAAFTK